MPSTAGYHIVIQDRAGNLYCVPGSLLFDYAVEGEEKDHLISFMKQKRDEPMKNWEPGWTPFLIMDEVVIDPEGGLRHGPGPLDWSTIQADVEGPLREEEEDIVAEAQQWLREQGLEPPQNA